MNRLITHRLHRAKVPAHFKGFRLLERAIELQMEDRCYAEDIWVKLYPLLAEEFNTTPINVERNIRHAISRSEKLAPMGTPHSTNAQFIADHAILLQLELARKMVK